MWCPASTPAVNVPGPTWIAVPPFPPCPRSLLPQHARVPSVARAPAVEPPTDTEETDLPASGEPAVVTATGVSTWVLVPLPSPPASLPPQQATIPSAVVAQAGPSPTEMCTIVFASRAVPALVTDTGVVDEVMPPLPRVWPPQHAADPSVSTAQVVAYPAASSVTVLPASPPVLL